MAEAQPDDAQKGGRMQIPKVKILTEDGMMSVDMFADIVCCLTAFFPAATVDSQWVVHLKAPATGATRRLVALRRAVLRNLTPEEQIIALESALIDAGHDPTAIIDDAEDSPVPTADRTD